MSGRIAHRRAGRRARGVRALATFVLCAALCPLASAQVAAPVLDAHGFLRATAGRPLELPRDHGSHPQTRTEWWYVTGALTDAGGATFGFQATWFRRALLAALPEGRSPLAARDVLLFHGALTDVAAGTHVSSERSCRAYPPWAHAREDALDVALLDDVLVAEGPLAHAARLRFSAGDAELDLTLQLDACAPLLHGEEPGLSLKGSRPGQASWYYSLPRVAVNGTLSRPGAPPMAVTGQAWLDHEFGSSQLSEDQTGWDWFSVALDDGSDLMLYRLRRADDGVDDASAGTLRRPRADTTSHAGETSFGEARFLRREDFAIESTGTWRSPRSGAEYPSGWTLRVPGESLTVEVTPLVRDQELATPTSTGVTYWEGLCSFRGTRAGRAVSGLGYVELVGYAGPLRDGL